MLRPGVERRGSSATCEAVGDVSEAAFSQGAQLKARGRAPGFALRATSWRAVDFRAMSARDHWFHCTTHTYGTWLRGDPRGWRSRNHREHVDGDYKHPPSNGKYDPLLSRDNEGERG